MSGILQKEEMVKDTYEEAIAGLKKLLRYRMSLCIILLRTPPAIFTYLFPISVPLSSGLSTLVITVNTTDLFLSFHTLPG